MRTASGKRLMIDTIETQYWEAHNLGEIELRDALGLALDASFDIPVIPEWMEDNAPPHGMARPRLPLKDGSPKSWADVARCGHRDCRATCRNDHATNQ